MLTFSLWLLFFLPCLAFLPLSLGLLYCRSCSSLFRFGLLCLGLFCLGLLSFRLFCLGLLSFRLLCLGLFCLRFLYFGLLRLSLSIINNYEIRFGIDQNTGTHS